MFMKFEHDKKNKNWFQRRLQTEYSSVSNTFQNHLIYCENSCRNIMVCSNHPNMKGAIPWNTQKQMIKPKNPPPKNLQVRQQEIVTIQLTNVFRSTVARETLDGFRAMKRHTLEAFLQDVKAYAVAREEKDKEWNSLLFRMRSDLAKKADKVKKSTK